MSDDEHIDWKAEDLFSPERLEHHRALAGEGEPLGLTHFAFYFYLPNELVALNEAKAVRLWQRATELGKPQEVSTAWFFLGICHYEGRGVTRSADEGIACWEKAYEASGCGSSAYQIFTHYSGGNGVEADPRQAKDWLLKAAEADSDDGWYALGVAYAGGDLGIDLGIEVSISDAEFCWRRAASMGNVNAQYNLGEAFVLGEATSELSQEEAEGFLSAVANQNEYPDLKSLALAALKSIGN